MLSQMIPKLILFHTNTIDDEDNEVHDTFLSKTPRVSYPWVIILEIC